MHGRHDLYFCSGLIRRLQVALTTKTGTQMSSIYDAGAWLLQAIRYNWPRHHGRPAHCKCRNSGQSAVADEQGQQIGSSLVAEQCPCSEPPVGHQTNRISVYGKSPSLQVRAVGLSRVKASKGLTLGVGWKQGSVPINWLPQWFVSGTGADLCLLILEVQPGTWQICKHLQTVPPCTDANNTTRQQMTCLILPGISMILLLAFNRYPDGYHLFGTGWRRVMTRNRPKET